VLLPARSPPERVNFPAYRRIEPEQFLDLPSPLGDFAPPKRGGTGKPAVSWPRPKPINLDAPAARPSRTVPQFLQPFADLQQIPHGHGSDSVGFFPDGCR